MFNISEKYLKIKEVSLENKFFKFLTLIKKEILILMNIKIALNGFTTK
jgi:hypothetical protein